MKQYYELHITMQANEFYDNVIKEAIAKYPKTWSFSAISDDINLGPGKKYYATTQINAKVSEFEVGAELMAMSAHLEEHCTWMDYFKILRRKIELVVFDQIAGRDFDKVETKAAAPAPAANTDPDDNIPF